MKISRNALACTVALLACSTCGALHAEEAGSWFIRGGLAYADFHASATVAIGGQQVPGGSATVHHNIGFAFETGYFLTPDWSVALTLGLPPTAKIYGAGSLASAGKLAEATYGPAVLALQYHLPTRSRFQPYLGLGVNYTLITRNHDAAIHHVHVDNGTGVALQAGIEYSISPRLALFIDAKKIWVGVDARGLAETPAGLIPATSHVTLNPVIWNTGVSFHF
ncbi:OmpW family outer membrane protein [Rhodanobacter sp. DHB23]|uniref:OmpW/AlkL family protein n=1 Tax=Rhodanobacter sp. DHB23 TaxID=2775923 RepID=UPI00177BE788|nr:OmpW family outer membrane protein [Rhodanobacter sp. DHB23]MBD8873679.1 OmpW family protein [Rhodanobacter sp. DHB23]